MIALEGVRNDLLGVTRYREPRRDEAISIFDPEIPDAVSLGLKAHAVLW
jgi:hypothetical protein